MSFIVSNEKLFAVKIINSEYYFLTNIQCSKCFETIYKCKIDYFSIIIEKNIKEWKLIAVETLKGKCFCKNY
jgi:hypothetical protein